MDSALTVTFLCMLGIIKGEYFLLFKNNKGKTA